MRINANAVLRTCSWALLAAFGGSYAPGYTNIMSGSYAPGYTNIMSGSYAPGYTNIMSRLRGSKECPAQHHGTQQHLI